MDANVFASGILFYSGLECPQAAGEFYSCILDSDSEIVINFPLFNTSDIPVSINLKKTVVYLDPNPVISFNQNNAVETIDCETVNININLPVNPSNWATNGRTNSLVVSYNSIHNCI